MLPLLPVIGFIAAGVLLDKVFTDDKPAPVVVTKTRFVKRGTRGINLPVFWGNDTIGGWINRNKNWLLANNITNFTAAAWTAKRGKKWFF